MRKKEHTPSERPIPEPQPSPTALKPEIRRATLMGILGSIVRRRDQRCILCGSTHLFSCHHLFKRAQGNWVVMFNPLYAVGLCQSCHDKADGAEREEIFDRIIRIIWQDYRMVVDLFGQEYTGEQRGQEILRYKNSVKAPQIIPADYRNIRKRLRTIAGEIERVAWFDDY